MGGDDLGSDDEFLQVAPNLESDDQHDFDETRTPERKEGEEKGSPSSGKRKSTAINSGVVESTYKKSKFASKNGALWEQDAQQQATFLSSALAKHLSPTLLSPPDVSPGILVTSKKESLVQRVTDIVSLNKIKKWNHKLSPCVIVICISARRAVQVLKEFSSTKARAAKLFPKNGSIQDQLKALEETAYGYAVCTPHRLEALCKGEGGVALSFRHTQLIVFDSTLSNKQFSVLTLPDTASNCMDLLGEYILPETRRRKDIRISLL